MRLPRIRLTVRRMMVAVAAIALFLFEEQTRRRWYVYSVRYETFDYFERESRKAAEHPQLSLCSMQWFYLKDRPDVLERMRREQAEWRGRQADHYAALRDKYARAMWCPFLPVAPDPPEPE